MNSFGQPDAEKVLDLLLKGIGIDQPYAWQREAFRRLLVGDIPGQIKVPTAAGKTLILPVFVAALASQSMAGKVNLPRRLVHVVNRRVLVDEAGSLGHRMAAAIETEASLEPIRVALGALSASGRPLAVSSLRGGENDNGQWSLDPSTAALVLATPDMIGSRLLFRGYGVGRSRSATHAGILGCDTLVVHDEAHLAPAFSRLLRQVEALSAPGAALVERPPLAVIEMTATLSAGSLSKPLVCDVASDPALAGRMSAPKRLRLIDATVADSKTVKPTRSVLDSIAAEALRQRDRKTAVAIFVSSPSSADFLATRLSKGGVDPQHIVTLTGTMRGHERAALASTEAFKRFIPGPTRTAGEVAYFIATSAGEIGLDIDAEVGIFDLTTLDRFIQRSGRVNRRGLGVGDIRLIHAAGEELPDALKARGIAALQHLQALPQDKGSSDASPLALSSLCDAPTYPDACEPPPAIRSLEPGIVAQLSLTSLRLDELKCPSPDTFIHGLVEEDADLKLAWRTLPGPAADLSEWLDVWPVAESEQAKLPFDAAIRLLQVRLMAAQSMQQVMLAVELDAQGMPAAGAPCLEAGMHVWGMLKRLRPGATVLLASAVGGVNAQGIPSADSPEPVTDVSSGFIDGNGLDRAATRSVEVTCTIGEEGAEWRSQDFVAGSLEDLLERVAGEHEVAFHDGPRELSGSEWKGTVKLWLSRRTTRSADAGDLASLTSKDRLLEEHLDLTARAARRLSARLGLRDEVRQSMIHAAAEHDRGKAWERWQRAIGNVDQSHPLGKSAQTSFNFRVNDGYRHELGSVVDCGERLTLLERHLVASHHGWCRPGFRSAALDKPGCAAAARLAADGYAALSGSLGPWALCYLESVLKSADILAEVHDTSLAEDPSIESTAAASWPEVRRSSDVVFRLPTDVSNFGEYLAGLGLASLLLHRGIDFTLGWNDGCLHFQGVGPEKVLDALQCLRSGAVALDDVATLADSRDAAYPPLMLHLGGGQKVALNHWMNERLRAKSAWKLGAGQTTAAGSLDSVVRACAATLDLQEFKPEGMFAIGGSRVGADTSKFRFDAATNWSARDAGFSLNESDSFKSTRPWVELLSVLGLQHFFAPPADTDPVYFTWRGQLSPLLALAAVKGLLPECDVGYRPVIEPSGQMKDVFTSMPLHRGRKQACPANIQVI